MKSNVFAPQELWLRNRWALAAPAALGKVRRTKGGSWERFQLRDRYQRAAATACLWAISARSLVVEKTKGGRGGWICFSQRQPIWNGFSRIGIVFQVRGRLVLSFHSGEQPEPSVGDIAKMQ